MMKIKKICLQNVGAFEQLNLDFQTFKHVKNKADIHIFTGPNGCGKTTLLLALASYFHSLQDEYQEPMNLLPKRFRYYNPKSCIEIETNEGVSAQFYATPTAIRREKDPDEKILQYIKYMREDTVPFRLEFAAFAYSGYRLVDNYNVNAIKDMNQNPLKDSLVFAKKTDYNSVMTINQWIANQISIHALKQLKKGKNSKNALVMEQFAQMMSEIVGYPIAFVLETEPIRLYVKAHDQLLDFDVLPDGLRSIISWLGDLLMRLDRLSWVDDTPIFEKPIFLFLDEIEVHLHPHWQRKILPMIQKLFKNAQIFITTHSPFIANSVDDATIYELVVSNGNASLAGVTRSKSSQSYETVLKDIFGVQTRFGFETQTDLDQFYKLRDALLDASKPVNEKDFLKLAQKLASQSEEIQYIIGTELRQLSKITQKKYNI